MTVSIFDDKSTEPTLSDLNQVLGKTATLLEDIELYLVDQLGELAREGQRAASVALESSLPEETLSVIDSAREYAEGRSIRFDVTTSDDVAVVMKLIAIKMSN